MVRRMKIGAVTFNIGKTGVSVTRNIGGVKLTTGKRTTATVRITKGVSVSSSGGRTRINRGRTCGH